MQLFQHMGDGAASGVQTPSQEGVIVRDGENFPRIPEYLLRLSPEELQRKVERVVRVIRENRESIFPSLKEEERLENTQALLQFAKTAVERQRKAAERE